jgi:hypothetical protein
MALEVHTRCSGIFLFQLQVWFPGKAILHDDKALLSNSQLTVILGSKTISSCNSSYCTNNAHCHSGFSCMPALARKIGRIEDHSHWQTKKGTVPIQGTGTERGGFPRRIGALFPEMREEVLES